MCSTNDGQFEEILSYSELMDSLESTEHGEGNVWKFEHYQTSRATHAE